MEIRFEAAGARLDRARALEAAGRPLDAIDEAREAARMFDAVGATREAERAEAIATRLASPAVEADRAGARRQAQPGFERLTARERDVLKLVSHGLSNHDIAVRLGLSEHTIHRHVSNILTKLELPSRAAAAAVAARAGAI